MDWLKAGAFGALFAYVAEQHPGFATLAQVVWVSTIICGLLVMVIPPIAIVFGALFVLSVLLGFLTFIIALL